MSEWIEYSADWAYWINPKTFRMPRVKKSVPPGAIILTKERETLDDGRQIVATYYSIARDGSTTSLTKKEASEILANQMLEFMKEKSMYPPKTEIKEVRSNGNVELSYDPTDFDAFVIRLTPTMVGGDVEEFLQSLKDFESEEQKSGDIWAIEPAKSSRSKCRTCGNKIEKGKLRLGEPSFFEDHLSYRWHHVECAKSRVKHFDPRDLKGFEDLTEEQQAQAQELLE